VKVPWPELWKEATVMMHPDRLTRLARQVPPPAAGPAGFVLVPAALAGPPSWPLYQWAWERARATALPSLYEKAVCPAWN
jgi:hypothetical protein